MESKLIPDRGIESITPRIRSAKWATIPKVANQDRKSYDDGLRVYGVISRIPKRWWQRETRCENIGKSLSGPENEGPEMLNVESRMDIQTTQPVCYFGYNEFTGAAERPTHRERYGRAQDRVRRSG